MTYTLELENKEDFAKVKKLLEQIKGAKLVENEDDYMQNEVPDYVYEALDKYAKTVKEEDCISEEEFFAKARRKVCGLYSQR